MAQTQVEIEVELSGAGKVEKGIQKIEGGLEGIGETGSKLTKSLGATNKKLGEGLESVSGTVGEVREAFGELGGAITMVGKTGAKGFLSLIGPLGMLVSAGIAVYETFRLITGAAQEAEEAQEAMNAAASDLQSKLESLAEKGVILSTKELVAFSKAVLESQIAKERIQFQFEKQKKVFMEVAEAQKELNDLTEQSTNLEKENFRTRMEALAGMTQARARLAKAYAREEKALARLNQEQMRAEESIKRAGEQEQELEKRGTDRLRMDALKLLNLEKEIKLIETRENTVADTELRIRRLGEVEAEYLETKVKLEEATRSEVQTFIKGIKERNKGLSESLIARRKTEEQIRDLQSKQIEKEVDEYEASRKILRDKRKVEREQRFRKEVALQTRLNQIKIKMEKEGIEQELALENERHRSILQLAKRNSLEEQVEEQRHLLAMKQIFDKAEMEKNRARELEIQKIQETNERELNLRYDLARRMTELEQQPLGFGTEIERLTFESEQRLNLLELEFQREINLARMRGEEITSIQRKYALERQAITQETLGAEIEVLRSYFDQYAAGFAAAGYNAIFFGDSFKQATSQILRGLGEQAAVQALMETATAFKYLAGGLIPNFAASIKSAGMYAAAAVAAGVASNALGGGGGGVAAPTTSPTGQPTTAPTPEREEATTSGMVFNINFGGAVVYDTKKAAEQALADRLVSIINTPRRGAVQFNRR
jgi:hypothetical protein